MDTLEDQRGVATRAQLLAVGCSDRVIARLTRQGMLIRLHPGAFAAATTWFSASERARHCMRVLALQLAAPDAVASGPSAALIWGLPTRIDPDRPVLVRAPHRPSIANATVRRSALTPDAITTHAGLLVTQQWKTVIDVAAEVSFPDALITVDAALRRGVECAALTDGLSRCPPVRNISAARRAIAFGDPYSESWLESLSRGRAIELGLPIPLCNVVLRFNGRWVRVDKLWLEHGVIGECDGKTKYADPATAGDVVWRERRRHEALEDVGFEVARWGTPDISRDGRTLAARFRRAAARQRRNGFTWPTEVTAEVPLLPGVLPTTWIIAEVARLAERGYPIAFADDVG